ncbi:MAG: FG-GAP repeat domain-containing protein, partial [Chthoniobacterales bacterium]
MKRHLPVRSFLAASILTVTLAGSAFGSHKAGDFPLPDVIASADFNRDGNLDLAVNLSGFDNVAILNGDGTGNFALKEHIESDTLCKGLALGDLNHDGNIDIVSISKWGYNIRVYLGDGLGGFIQVNELKGDGEPTRVVLADINNDGNLDIVSNAPDEGKIQIYFGLGSGGFSNTPLEIDGLYNSNDLLVADLNHDGKLDLAVLDLTSQTLTSTVVILLGDGAGGFTVASQIPISHTAATISLCDLN